MDLRADALTLASQGGTGRPLTAWPARQGQGRAVTTFSGVVACAVIETICRMTVALAVANAALKRSRRGHRPWQGLQARLPHRDDDGQINVSSVGPTCGDNATRPPYN